MDEREPSGGSASKPGVGRSRRRHDSPTTGRVKPRRHRSRSEPTDTWEMPVFPDMTPSVPMVVAFDDGLDIEADAFDTEIDVVVGGAEPTLAQRPTRSAAVCDAATMCDAARVVETRDSAVQTDVVVCDSATSESVLSQPSLPAPATSVAQPTTDCDTANPAMALAVDALGARCDALFARVATTEQLLRDVLAAVQDIVLATPTPEPLMSVGPPRPSRPFKTLSTSLLSMRTSSGSDLFQAQPRSSVFCEQMANLSPVDLRQLTADCLGSCPRRLASDAALVLGNADAGDVFAASEVVRRGPLPPVANRRRDRFASGFAIWRRSVARASVMSSSSVRRAVDSAGASYEVSPTGSIARLGQSTTRAAGQPVAALAVASNSGVKSNSNKRHSGRAEAVSLARLMATSAANRESAGDALNKSKVAGQSEPGGEATDALDTSFSNRLRWSPSETALHALAPSRKRALSRVQFTDSCLVRPGAEVEQNDEDPFGFAHRPRTSVSTSSSDDDGDDERHDDYATDPSLLGAADDTDRAVANALMGATAVSSAGTSEVSSGELARDRLARAPPAWVAARRSRYQSNARVAIRASLPSAGGPDSSSLSPPLGMDPTLLSEERADGRQSRKITIAGKARRLVTSTARFVRLAMNSSVPQESNHVVAMDTMYIAVAVALSVAATAAVHSKIQPLDTPPSAGLVAFNAVLQAFSMLWMALRFAVRVREAPTSWEVIDDLPTIRERYMRSWFAFDFMCAFPIEVLFLGWSPSFYRFIMLRQVLRLARFPSVWRLANPLLLRSSMVAVACFLGVLIFALHCMACIALALSLQSNMTYTTALYFTITTCATVGYGDVVPAADDTTSRFFSMFVMVGGAVVVSSSTAMMTFFSSSDALSEEVNREKRTIDEMLRHIDVPWSVRRDTTAMTASLLDRRRQRKFTALLSAFPPHIAATVNVYVHAKLLRRIPAFANVALDSRPEVLLAVSRQMRRRVFEPHEPIVKAGDACRALYFLARGVATVQLEVELQAGESDRGSNGLLEMCDAVDVGTMRPGTWFGNTDDDAGAEHSVTVRADTSCEVFAFTASVLKAIATEMPEAFEMLQAGARAWLVDQAELLRLCLDDAEGEAAHNAGVGAGSAEGEARSTSGVASPSNGEGTKRRVSIVVTDAAGNVDNNTVISVGLEGSPRSSLGGMTRAGSPLHGPLVRDPGCWSTSEVDSMLHVPANAS